MKCFKRNQCKGKPMVCPQKGSIPIKALIFLTAFIMLSFGAVFVAQSQHQGDLVTLEEENLLRLHQEWQYARNTPDYVKRLEEFDKSMIHYARDDCKKRLQGQWIFRGQGSIVNITYDDKYKVFKGHLTRIVKMKCVPKDNWLFKVYFDKYFGVALPERIDIAWLRKEKQCRVWMFAGTETSCDPNTKKQTVSELRLTLNDNVLVYQADKDAYYLDRLR